MADAKRRKPGSKPPISRHPLFPATVALWFGALFGLASMALKSSMLEKLVLATGLPSVIPASEPPLGATTQMLVAIAMAGLGGIIGAVLARRLARPKPVAKVRRRVRVGTQPAIVAGGDLGQRRIDADHPLGLAPAQAIKRRQLAMDEDNRPADYREHAPVPGGTLQILDVTEFDLEGFEAEAPNSAAPAVAASIEPEAAEARKTFGVKDVEEYRPPEFSPPEYQPPAFDPPEGAQVFGESGSEHALTFERQIEVEAREGAPFVAGDIRGAEPQGLGEKSEHADTASGFAGLHAEFSNDLRWPAAEPQAEAGPFSAPVEEAPVAFAQREQEPADAMDCEAEVQASSFVEPATAASQVADEESEPATTASRIMTASLGALSHVELLERLAMTLDRSRSQQDPGATASHAMQFETAFALDAAGQASMAELAPQAPGAEETGQHQAQPPVPLIPAALRPLVFEDDSDSDLLPSFVPPRNFSMSLSLGQAPHETGSAPRQSEAEGSFDAGASEAAGESQELEAGYSSLLSLSRSDRPQFVRIEMPDEDHGEIKPFVVFPGEGASGEGPFVRPGTDQIKVTEALTGNSPMASLPAGESQVYPFGQPKPGDDGLDHAGVAAFQPDPEETERSLKAALASLQRMSGAA